jgi:muconolactone delta-isomerase
VILVRRLHLSWVAGIALYWWVLVRRDAPERERLIAHEQVHIAQQRRDGLLRFLWRYLARGQWRARYEAEAYAEDVRRGRPLEQCVQAIYRRYRTGLTEREIERLIRSWL